MSDIEELQHTIAVLRKYDLPLSPILEYAIKEKIEELSCSGESSTTTNDNVTQEDVVLEPSAHSLSANRKRKKSTTLRVIRANGSVLEKKKAADTLSQVVREIGVGKVYELKLPLDGMYLVTKGGNPQYPDAQHEVGCGYFVNSHSNTATKKRQLEKIFNALKLNWKVEITEPK